MTAKTKKRGALKDPSFLKFMAQVPNMLPETVQEPVKPYTKSEMRRDVEEMNEWSVVAMTFWNKANEYRETAPDMSAYMKAQATKYTAMVTGLIEQLNKNMERY